MIVHRPDLVDGFLRTGLSVFQDLICSAVPVRMSSFGVPGILLFHMLPVVHFIKSFLNVLERFCQINILRRHIKRQLTISVITVPVDVILGHLLIDVIGMIQIEVAVIVFGTEYAILAGAAIMPCQSHL